ncbi:AAA family ATPase [Cyanobium sp. WKJ7-Wakatipu]|uniref:AAA domain-containing protein n=1 Tax=Cyanobium sp. WKJ7-Wakatipu TaxID=2823726 RepID=UPI0020CC0EF2|nr:AAA domain-containing protein [Cyanobium sp. WKJ7-Wakatipu]MCP9784284.1 AAA family ATPase [Cyanobium sp. WKJ7-Wakatipu]
MTIRLVKTCPSCGHANDPGEFYCVGILATGLACGFTILDEPPLPEGGQPIHPEPAAPASELPGAPEAEAPEAEAPADEATSDGRWCLNGHAMQANDEICLSCGASAVGASEHLDDDASSSAMEAITGQRLDAIPAATRADDTFLRTLLRAAHTQLETDASDGRGHGAICPDAFVIPSLEPLEVSLLESAVAASQAPGRGDLTLNGHGQVSRYSPPEQLIGIQSPASDWWSVGLVLLEQWQGPGLWEGIHERAWLLQVITEGVAIPAGIEPDWRDLLMGLLTRDHSQRWGAEQVGRWLSGDRDIAIHYETAASEDAGEAISLGGVRHRTPARYALAAAQEQNWGLALEQLTNGELLTWLEQKQWDSEPVAEIRRLANDGALPCDERLMVVLLLLNPNLPLCFKGDLVTPANLAATPERSRDWLRGSVPERLLRIGRQTWLADLAARRSNAMELARSLKLSLEEARFEAAALVSNRQQLEAAWAQRRRDWPDAVHQGVLNLISKGNRSAEELLLLISAPLEQFRSAALVLEEARQAAATAELLDGWSDDAARSWLEQERRSVLRTLADRLADFVRCGIPLADHWADQFRYERRISLARALVLLAIPHGQWQRPEGGEHWQRLMHFFQRRVLGGIQRGPLLALSIKPGGDRIDLNELGSDVLPAQTLLDHVVSRRSSLRLIDPSRLEEAPGLAQRLRRLRQTVDAYQRETGIAALHLGFPLLLLKPPTAAQDATRQSNLVPVLLWPVQIGSGQQGAGPSLGFDSERQDGEGIRLNPALTSLLSQGQRLELEAAALEISQRAALTGVQVMEVLSTIFPSSDLELKPCPQERKLAKDESQRLCAAAALFHCTFSAQTLAHELAQLERRPALEGPMASLLRLGDERAVSPGSQESDPSQNDLILVSQADPSQKRAVAQARQTPGVLIQGPPGTGKSQTIVNVVADAIGRGERVLVVCQKQAALEVVRNRLDAVGLGAKLALITDPGRDRRIVLQQLRQQLDNLAQRPDARSLAPAREAIATDVYRLESELDDLHQAMAMAVGSSGFGYGQVIEELIAAQAMGSSLDLPGLRPGLVGLHHEQVRTLAELGGDLAPLWLRAKAEGSALKVLQRFSTDPGNLASLQDALSKLADAEQYRQQACLEASLHSGGVLEPQDATQTEYWLKLHGAAFVAASQTLAALLPDWLPLFSDSSGQALEERLAIEIRQLRLMQEPGIALRWHSVLEHVNDDDLDELNQAAARWLRWHRSLLRHVYPRFGQAKATLGALANDALGSGAAGVAELKTYLDHAIGLRVHCRALESIQRALGLDARVINRRPLQLLGQLEALAALLQEGRGLVEGAAQCPEPQACELALQSGRAESLRDLVGGLRLGIQRQVLRQRSLQRLDTLTPWFQPNWIASCTEAVALNQSIGAELAAIAAAMPTVVDYQLYDSRTRGLSEQERHLLSHFSAERSCLEQGPETAVGSTVRQTIWREALLAWRSQAEADEPVLLLAREDVERRVERLAAQDERLVAINREQTAALQKPERVLQRAQWDEVVMLTGPRARKLREVVELGEERGLFELKPVWLANPETVARIFPLRQDLFDLVIFDEASQLPVEHALPALYRAGRVVISGDDKQLPPTRFFNTGFATDSDDDSDGLDVFSEDAIEAQEIRRQVKDCSNLLELATAAGLAEVSLDIHYRSTYRPLISHSNAAFYQGKLSVPALHPADEIRKRRPLELIAVNGIYEGQSNRDEAEAIVAFLAELWSSHHEAPSLGVVSFNKNQADLIEDLLEERADQDQAFFKSLVLERARRHNGEDCGFFVKNLENVQGDERDWILFSTTFGRDRQGRFNRVFGALGQQGGERRLNVATSRARDKVVIFNSMPIEEISDLPRSRRPPETARDFLQSYLIYAAAISDGRLEDAERWLERINDGPRHGTSIGAAQGSGSGFVAMVAEHLEGLGYAVERAPAQDAFGFDLAIRDPATGLFALGIECDAPRHHDLRQARDREIWRPAVLKRCVPHTHRIWSRLWLADTNSEKRRLQRALQQALPTEQLQAESLPAPL